jgi:hypothetical protein
MERPISALWGSIYSRPESDDFGLRPSCLIYIRPRFSRSVSITDMLQVAAEWQRPIPSESATIQELSDFALPYGVTQGLYWPVRPFSRKGTSQGQTHPNALNCHT